MLMNILVAASEVVPFAKTGGLADVAGALPLALAELGHRVTVILPNYRACRRSGRPVRSTGMTLTIPIGTRRVEGEVLESSLGDGEVPVFLIDQPDYFDRDGLYQEGGKDYPDNSERFVFFSRAVLETIRLMELEIDVLHANDWQTGLVPVYLETEYRRQEGLKSIGTLFTVHNLGYQGQFWHWDMLLTGLDWKLFNWQQLEFYGYLNLMKAGLVFADAINTVSRRYAQEIQTSEYGHGLEGVLQSRRNDLYGIVNGIDYGVWNPAVDPHLAAHYDEQSVGKGKPQCKAALQKRFKLPERPEVPVLGQIGRLADQKGWDLVAAVADELLREDVQIVVLGTGEAKYHELLQELVRRYPTKVGLMLGFDNGLAHQIEAGADMFLMPSRYEPCGLNQLYSLKYGTVPVVRATGGLADTIVDSTPPTLASGTATGFSFEPYNAATFLQCVRRALGLWKDRAGWQRLVQNGMRQDWSWGHSAQEYLKVYEKVWTKRAQAVAV